MDGFGYFGGLNYDGLSGVDQKNYGDMVFKPWFDSAELCRNWHLIIPHWKVWW